MITHDELDADKVLLKSLISFRRMQKPIPDGLTDYTTGYYQGWDEGYYQGLREAYSRISGKDGNAIDAEVEEIVNSATVGTEG